MYGRGGRCFRSLLFSRGELLQRVALVSPVAASTLSAAAAFLRWGLAPCVLGKGFPRPEETFPRQLASNSFQLGHVFERAAAAAAVEALPGQRVGVDAKTGAA